MIQRFEKHYRFFHVFFLVAGVLTLLIPVHLFMIIGDKAKGDPILDIVNFLGPSTSLIVWPLQVIFFFSFAVFFLSLFTKHSLPSRFNLGLHTGIPSIIAILIVFLFRFNPFATVTPLILLLVALFLLGGSYYLVKRFDSIDSKDEANLKESRLYSLVGMGLGAICFLLFVLMII